MVLKVFCDCFISLELILHMNALNPSRDNHSINTTFIGVFISQCAHLMNILSHRKTSSV